MNKLNVPFESVFGSHATKQASNMQRRVTRGGSTHSPCSRAAQQRGCCTGWRTPCTVVKEKLLLILKHRVDIVKKKGIINCSHQWWHGWPQQVTLVLNILNETIEERGVGLCLCLSISEEGDAVLAHINTFLERFKVRHMRITSSECHHLVKNKVFSAYLLWSLLVFGVLRIEQQGHVEKERRLILGKVDLGDFIGQKLLILLDLNFSQSCLLRLTQPKGSTHHTGILLKDTYHSNLNQHWGNVCNYIADADKLDDPIFKAHMTSFLLPHRRYSRWELGGQHSLLSHETQLHKTYSVPFRHWVTSSSIFSLPHFAHTFSSFK